ncbi:hypothetical protein [Rhabdaerophilum sp. SD176]|uniref:hypothetical protein n=1 Tax=Rhabdaerophilum sp. SD176 TaxID=2983548 RepID=UPI0024DF3556|nr:hypothetical protein [Rhabdaerophilum sp. SD176]
MADKAAEILSNLLLSLGSSLGLIEERTLALHAVAGQEIRVQNVWHLNDDCTQTAPIRMVVTLSAAMGEVDAMPVEDFIDADDEGMMRKCGSRRVPSLDIRYASRAGQNGQDRFGFAVIFKDGTVWNHKVTIRILRPAPQLPEDAP